MKKEEKALIIGKRIECCIGIFLLIPPILGVIAFTLCLFGVEGKFASLRNLLYFWCGFGQGAMSAAPIYMAIMAFVGAYLIKDSLKYLFLKDE